jgi:hypothetical protein
MVCKKMGKSMWIEWITIDDGERQKITIKVTHIEYTEK